MTFDKTKVVPPEYARVLDQNIKFHFLEGTGITLHTIDDSDFNIVISNNQKIIVKKKRKADTPADILFGSGSLLADIYGNDDDDSDVWDDASLIDNQRFKKLCRLPQLGVYVDEAHHLFGADLEKELRSGGANKTTLRNTINMLAASTSIVACYNYTGTPYVKKQVLEVKGDNKIDDEVVLAKKAAAEEMAVASGVHYLMYAGSTLMKSNVLEPTLAVQQTSIDI